MKNFKAFHQPMRIGRLTISLTIPVILLGLALYSLPESPAVQAAALRLPSSQVVTHSVDTTHQAQVLGNGRIINRYLNDNGTNQIDQTGDNDEATTVAIMFDQHLSTTNLVDVGVQNDFYPKTLTTLNNPSNFQPYSEDSLVVYASKVLSYQVTQRTLTTDAVHNDWLIMELTISNTGDVDLTGGKLLYRVDIDVAEVQVGDTGDYSPTRQLVFQTDQDGNIGRGYAMGVSLLKGNLAGYGSIGNGYAVSDMDIKSEMLTPANTVINGDNQVSWLVVDLPPLSARQETSVVFGLCAKTGPNQEKAEANLYDCIDGIVYEPVLAITRVGPTQRGVNDEASYIFDIRHAIDSDGIPVGNIVVEDSVAGPAAYVGGDSNGNDKLDRFETWRYYVSYTIQPDDPDPLFHIGTVRGKDTRQRVVTASDTYTTFVEYNPTLAIAKDGPDAGRVKTTVAYEFAVSHASDSDGSPISDIAVNDNVAGEANYVKGDTDADNDLDFDETWLYTVSYTIPVDASDFLINEGRVEGRDRDNDLIEATDQHTLEVISTPLLEFTKRAGSTIASVGDSVTYVFDVSHAPTSNDAPVSNIILRDDLTSRPTYLHGDSNLDNKLDAGETWNYIASYVVKPTDSNPLVNTATVASVDSTDKAVVATATHTMTLRGFRPRLKLEMSGPDTAGLGQAVDYNFSVRHAATSDGSPVGEATIRDNIVPDLVYTRGDVNSNNKLDSRETWLYTAGYIVQPTDPDPLVNTAMIQAFDAENDVITAAATHRLDVAYEPVLDLALEGPRQAQVGDEVTFEVTVNHHTLSDRSPVRDMGLKINQSVVTLASGDMDFDGQLDANETWRYSASFTIPDDASGKITYSATADGVDQDSDPTISDEIKREIVIISDPPGPIYLPVVWRNFVIAPDLVVDDIRILSSSMVEVVIKNKGNWPIKTQDIFYVDLYINPTFTPKRFDQTFEKITPGGQGIVWQVKGTSILPEKTLVLNNKDDYYNEIFSNFSGSLPSNSTIYVQVDTTDNSNDAPHGKISETHEVLDNPNEYNNVTGPVLSPFDNSALPVEPVPSIFDPVQPRP